MAGELDLSAVEEPDDPDVIIHTEPHVAQPYPWPRPIDVRPADGPSPAADLRFESDPSFTASQDPTEQSDFAITVDRDLKLSREPTGKGDLTFVSDRGFNAAKEMHKARRDVATWVFLLLASVIVVGTTLVVIASVAGRNSQQAKDLFLNVFTAILALASSTVGYYYGTTERGDRDG